MAGSEERKEKEIDVKELANLDSLVDIFNEITSSCMEELFEAKSLLMEKKSLLLKEIESTLQQANETLFGEAELPTEIPIAAKQQVQAFETRLQNNVNGVFNANSATRMQTQGMANNQWKPVLSSVQSIAAWQKKVPYEKKIMNAVAKLDIFANECEKNLQKMEDGYEDGISFQNFAAILIKHQASYLIRSVYRLNPFSLVNYVFGDIKPSPVNPDCLSRDDSRTIETRYSAAAFGKKRTFHKSVVLACDNVADLVGQNYSHVVKAANKYKRKISRPSPEIIADQMQEILRKAELRKKYKPALRNAPATYNAIDEDNQRHSTEIETESNSFCIYSEISTDISLVVCAVIMLAFCLGIGHMFNIDLS